MTDQDVPIPFRVKLGQQFAYCVGRRVQMDDPLMAKGAIGDVLESVAIDIGQAAALLALLGYRQIAGSLRNVGREFRRILERSRPQASQHDNERLLGELFGAREVTGHPPDNLTNAILKACEKLCLCPLVANVNPSGQFGGGSGKFGHERRASGGGMTDPLLTARCGKDSVDAKWVLRSGLEARQADKNQT
jgi:hypothetical protein